jgi:hypothetical protein
MPFIATSLRNVNYSSSRPNDRREVFPNPSRDASTATNRNATYEQLFAYYSNTAFEDVAGWARYRLRHSLYRYTRGIFNPVARVVDFYGDHVYPGSLILDPEAAENPRRSAMPFAYNTPKEITKVAGQMWQWSNWNNGNALMVRYGALTGNVFVDIIDDVDSGKIRYQVHYPSVVKHLELDPYGNVKAVVLEWVASDKAIDGGRPFTYAKEMQKDFIATYKNGEPFSYFGRPAIIENPYGFVPGVWVKHGDLGGDYGVPAIGAAIPKIDELNSIVSHTADHIHKQIESPRIIWSKATIKPMFGRDSDYQNIDSRQQQVLLKAGDGDGKTETLVGTLDPQTIVPIMEKLIAEIEKDYPEITMYEKLRDQNIVTSPGAQKLTGDVARKMSRPAANYDAGNTKLVQMGSAIGGMRANNGDWGSSLSPQQQKFLPFDLSSYNKGELDFTILERDLAPPSTKEIADEMSVRANAVSAVADAVPAAEKLRMLGKREDEIPKLLAELEAERERKLQEEARRLEQQAAARPEPEGRGEE